ncbi:MAG: hypothetical protein RL412_646, partial [Pseudomonadota bacterium]
GFGAKEKFAQRGERIAKQGARQHTEHIVSAQGNEAQQRHQATLRVMQTCEFDAIGGETDDVLRELPVQEFSRFDATHGEDAEVGEGDGAYGGVIHGSC